MPYRTGRHLGRTIYRATSGVDALIGIMDTAPWGERVVAALTAREAAGNPPLDTEPMPYRTGEPNGRTVYRSTEHLDGELLGIMDTGEWAQRVVAALNWEEQQSNVDIHGSKPPIE